MADFSDNEAFWDDKFTGATYRFGTEPADFLVTQAGHVPPRSRVLCICDGEGRNSVYLAGLGHEVTAFDLSSVGIGKARTLAEAQGVAVDFIHAGVEDWDWSRPYDAVVAIFVQFAGPALRARMFYGMAQATAPGGLLMLHGYAPRQVGYGTGGPPAAENMYTLDLLNDVFAGWDVLHSADEDRHVDEGPGHSGRSALIDFVARKPR